MSIDQDIANSSKILAQDVEINHEITHGDKDTEVPTEGGPVPTIAKRLHDIETEWSQQADPLAEELAEAVQLTQQYRDESWAVLEQAVLIHILPMATNLIRTQAIVTEHHAFK